MKTAEVRKTNNHYADMFLNAPVVANVINMWVDLMFPVRLVLGGVSDEKVLDYYYTVVDDSGILPSLPILATDYFVFGRFIAQLLEDAAKGHWTHCFQPSLSYCSIQVMLNEQEPRVTITVSKQLTEWANSTDPKIVDPRVLHSIGKGEDIELDPAHTLFLARRSHAYDYCGTSWLAGIDPNTMSTAEMLWRLHVDVSKLHDEKAFTAHYVEAATRVRDHITDYVFTQKMFPHIAATHGYGKLIPTVEWLPLQTTEPPRSIVLRTLEGLGVPLDELAAQQEKIQAQLPKE